MLEVSIDDEGGIDYLGLLRYFAVFGTIGFVKNIHVYGGLILLIFELLPFF